MRVYVYYKDTHFVLENCEEVGITKVLSPITKRYRKYIFFVDTEFGELLYPTADIKRLYVYKD